MNKENITIVEKSKGKGRPTGTSNKNVYKWRVIIYNKETNQLSENKYCSIKELNNTLGLTLNSDYVRRIITGYRTDQSMRNGKNSFLARYGHIKLEKINEMIK